MVMVRFYDDVVSPCKTLLCVNVLKIPVLFLRFLREEKIYFYVNPVTFLFSISYLFFVPNIKEKKQNVLKLRLVRNSTQYAICLLIQFEHRDSPCKTHFKKVLPTLQKQLFRFVPLVMFFLPKTDR